MKILQKHEHVRAGNLDLYIDYFYLYADGYISYSICFLSCSLQHTRRMSISKSSWAVMYQRSTSLLWQHVYLQQMAFHWWWGTTKKVDVNWDVK